MKAVIFAGGMGTRLSEETDARPKPMVKIGDYPIIWHIMKLYDHFGIDDFIICCGYKGEMVKSYFATYCQRYSDVTFDFRNNENEIVIHKDSAERWRVTLINTGANTQTGGRLAQIKDYVGKDDFCLTYGDGVADIDIHALIKFHKEHDRIATVTAVQPLGRFGALDIEESAVKRFIEKPSGDGNWINGGFFVLKPSVFDYIPSPSDNVKWEEEPMRALTEAGQLQAFKHKGFWQPMDTLREKNYLEALIQKREAPWMLWNEEQKQGALKVVS